MRGMGSSSEEYLQAFMSGFEFVLLAMRGRLEEGTLPDAERARVEEFLADYWRIARAFHDRHDAPVTRVPVLKGPINADVPPAMTN